MWLSFVRLRTLPPLAWYAEILRRGEVANVLHGSSVEIRDGALVEGAWSGDYERMAFAEAPTFTGTGARRTNAGLLFSAPTHTLQAIYLVRARDRLAVSNSLAFLLTQVGDGAAESYRYYEFDLMSVMDGLKRYVRAIPTRRGNRLFLYYHCNLLVSRDLHVTPLPKTRPGGFESFANYYRFLETEVREVVANAGDSRRTVRYTPLTTVSSGYDSPACAVLARRAGCTEALTFTTARDDFAERNDSGLAIGRALGLVTVEVDPEQYKHHDDLPEAEILATGMGGDDLVYESCTEILGERLLFTGYHGDKVWARINDKVSPHIVRGDPSGGSLAELRLRVGFLHCPIPFIGCTEHESIHAISNSSDMTPWSIAGTQYDRPIPRRIVEEAGIPRARFGQSKKAVARPVHTTGMTDPPLDQVLSPSSLKDFRRWSASVSLFASWSDAVRYRVLHALYRLNDRIIHSHKLRRLAGMVGFRLPETLLISWRYGKPRTLRSVLFHWGMARIGGRYTT